MPVESSAFRLQADVAAHAAADERLAFLRKTYMHLLGAVVGFVVLLTLAYQLGLARQLVELIAPYRWGWAIVLGLFMLASYVADRWASPGHSTPTQYAGLGLLIVAEAFIFSPLLYYVLAYGPPQVLPKAAIITLAVFTGLTMIVCFTRKDFSFLRPFLSIAGFVAIALIGTSILFGFQLGDLFVVAMILFASAGVLYSTSNVLNKYPVGSHVAAALSLFAGIALLFYYVLIFMMSLSGSD